MPKTMMTIFRYFKFPGQLAFMIGIILALYLIMDVHTAFAQSAAEPSVATADEFPAPVCRLGVNVNDAYGEPPIDGFDTAPLRLGWYIDYRARLDPPRPQGMAYAPVIRLKQTGPDSYNAWPHGSALDEAVAVHQGEGVAWFIGNEPDRRYYQDDIEPQVYAKAYHELRDQIKAIDPSAKVLAGAIVQATEVRIKYLDLILESHLEQYGAPMEADGWAFHGFILNEVSCTDNPLGIQCWGADIPPGVDDSYGLVIDVQESDDFDIFTENAVRMRQWMADNGYRNTPLYLSEYGVLMPAGRFNPDFTPERVNAFMTKSFNYVLYEGVDPQIGYPQDGNRLIQYLSWYSTSDDTDFNGNLYDLSNNNRLSLMGENYAAEAAKIKNDHDFMPLDVTVGPEIIILDRGDQRQALVRVGVRVANAGNNFIPVAASVRIFDGHPAAGGAPIGDGIAHVRGCGEEATGYALARLPWDGVSLDDLPTSLTVYAQVNPDNKVGEVEGGEYNNLMVADLSLDGLSTTEIAIDIAAFLPLIQHK